MSRGYFWHTGLRCLLRYFVGRWIEKSGVLSMWLIVEATECIYKKQRRELQTEVKYFIFKWQGEDNEHLKESERLKGGVEEKRVLVINSTLYCAHVHACLHAKLLQSCPTLCDSMGCSPLGSSVHGILWVSSIFQEYWSSRGSSQPKDRTCISCGSSTAGRFFTSELLGKSHSHPYMFANLASCLRPKENVTSSKRFFLIFLFIINLFPELFILIFIIFTTFCPCNVLIYTLFPSTYSFT